MTRHTDRELIVVGAGGFGRETVEAVRALNAAGARWRLVGYLDDDPARNGTEIDEVPVLGATGRLGAMPDVCVVVCTGRPDDYTSRMRIVQALGLPAERYATIIHPSASVSSTSRVGPGSVLLAQTVLSAAVTVGSHVAIMPHVTLTHDDVIGDFATVASGVRLGGGVRVGECAYLGAGALVREQRSIGPGALVGMGAVVTHDVPAGQVWTGLPARYLREAATAAASSGADGVTIGKLGDQ
ncbi:MAG TPA: acetyltransferase [Streptosporangiaceae bacterium]|jgi:sugar O-acyltransferase (sialic acid O-acetyltransferase NeuD family)